MKPKFLFLLYFFVLISYGQQNRNGISYQAMIIDTKGTELPGYDKKNSPLINKNVCVKFEIIDHNGFVEYAEQTKVMTDKFGMINIVIGTGQRIGINDFNKIKWTTNSKKLKVFADITGMCGSYELISDQEFTSVPFALYSPTSDIPGPKGDSAYKVWINEGNEGNEEDFLESLIGPQGKSAYEIWIENGNIGNVQDFLDSLIGPTGVGTSGQSAYEIWLKLGNEGSELDFINSLKGRDGIDGNGGGDVLNLPNGEIDGDILQWIWKSDKWEYTIIKPDDTGIILTSGDNSRNQTICETDSIIPISYAFTGDVNNIIVSGLPSGINYQIIDNVLNISGAPTINVDNLTSFKYIITLSNGTKTLSASGNISIYPRSLISLKSGNIILSSCLNKPIEPVQFSIDSNSPNITATGLPEGISAVVNGDIITLQGTPSIDIVNGSVYNYTLISQSAFCSATQITGSISFSDCTSCIPIGSAGSDDTICSGESYSLKGSASNFSSILWTTSGTGLFNNVNATNPLYTPSLADINAGGVTLTVTINNTSCTNNETIVDSMYLNISNCSQIDIELQNNDEAYLFAYELDFGAKIITNNIQEVASVGLCYNTTGGPTINDNNVSQNYTNSGFWTSVDKTFSMSLSGVPVSKLYVRPFATSIGGDVFYGDQIEVNNYDPNRNQIYNFKSVSGDFNPRDYNITTTSDIHFVNITKLNAINWDFGTGPPNYSNILEVNFPNLTKVDNIRVINEKSLTSFNAPKLKEISYGVYFKTTSLVSINFPELELLHSVGINFDFDPENKYGYNSMIIDNPILTNINLNKLKGFYSTFIIRNNPKLQILDFQSIESSQKTTSEFIHYLKINNNNDLQTVVFAKNPIIRLFIETNPALASIEFPNAINLSNSEININSNNSLTVVNLPSVTELRRFELLNNPEILSLNLPNIEKIHSRLYIFNNDKLSNLSFPSLILTGSNVFKENSLSIEGNALLANVNFDNTRKVYGNLNIKNNNQLNLNEFNCNLYVYENDGFDCTPGTLSISGNLDNNYCFQDSNLIIPPTITTSTITNITSTQAVSGGMITASSKMTARGCVWGITQSPTLEDNINYSINGNLNGSFTSYISNLEPGTTYYLRAYGVDCNGTYYGNVETFTTPN
ncbi:MAG: hypothetical protein ACO3A1_02675 [Flavobacteriaceae bacterium]